eukprot:TRINITY_DN7120_c0_g1_i1.p1 TRINITY_DN7120_c0_g1~~TRINITY_DN7120_c0_g1_i1.p1  ORF type:complete len:862 (+),score=281.44 TRINITY_DN7120_c0_g1_i1:95-2680(+)
MSSETSRQIECLIAACLQAPDAGGDKGAISQLVELCNQGHMLQTLESLKHPLKKESDPDGQLRILAVLEGLMNGCDVSFLLQIASERWMTRLIQVAKGARRAAVRDRILQLIVDWDCMARNDPQRGMFLVGFSQHGVQRLQQSKTLTCPQPSVAPGTTFASVAPSRGALPPPHRAGSPPPLAHAAPVLSPSHQPQAVAGVKSPAAPGLKTAPVGAKAMPGKTLVAPAGWQGGYRSVHRDPESAHKAAVAISDLDAFIMDVNADVAAMQMSLMRPELFDRSQVDDLNERMAQIQLALQRQQPPETTQALTQLMDDIRETLSVVDTVGSPRLRQPGVASPSVKTRAPPGSQVHSPTSSTMGDSFHGGSFAGGSFARATWGVDSEVGRLREALREKEATELRLQRELDRALMENERLRAAAGAQAASDQLPAAAARAHVGQVRTIISRSRQTTLDLMGIVEQGKRAITGQLRQAIEGMERLAKQPNAQKVIKQLQENYMREMRLRKKYYNDLQELRGNIRVYCRVRPMLEKESSEGHRNITSFPPNPEANDEITIRDDAGDGRVRPKRYEFDRVFREEEGQDVVFQDTRPLIESVVDGYNVCIFAYGQTGSGKTWTMEGPRENPGVNTRALERLFEVIDERRDEETTEVSLSILEIYNESIRDLMVDPKVARERKYEVRIGGETGNYVTGLEQVSVSSLAEIHKHCETAHRNRHTGKTNMNEHSSRSHMILYFVVRTENRATGCKCHGKLSLIDLAGSERLKKSQAEGLRAEEAKCINLSLTTLGKTISAIGQKQAHVPYRESKLTHLLQDSLGGQSKVLMFANISPASYNSSETTSTLDFAIRAREVALGKAERNVSKGDAKR